MLTWCFVWAQVWDGDGGESVVSTKDSLGDDNLDDCGLGNLSVRARALSGISAPCSTETVT